MKRGFTLVELIVVVIIIGILAAVGIPQYVKALERSRGAEAYAGLGNIQQGEKLYYANNESYMLSAEMSLTDQQKLDISLPMVGWTFDVATSDSNQKFTATATRRVGKGPCSVAGKNTITVTQTGVISDSAWKSCVDAL